MLYEKTSRRGRGHLDSCFTLDSNGRAQELVIRLARPEKGWIKAIREALGMSASQLAKRVGVSQPVITNIEASEVAGTVKLVTLERVAVALNCRLVYALVPNEPLETMVQERTRQIAEHHLSAVEHSMRLENQAVDDDIVRNQHLQIVMSEIDPRRLWD